MTMLSVLDLAPIPEGSDARAALHRARDLARLTERLGFKRYWLAEHHNMTGIASAATAVAIGFVAGSTETIRVGAGGIMLPNHAPLVVAEQFGTLATLYPGRIDLGLGRAPGTDQRTWRALRRDPSASDRFPQDVLELQALLGNPSPNQAIHAIPGEATHIPLWILGSSTFGAQLAAHLGLPYAFASHFAPEALHHALRAYRDGFQPGQIQRPHAMVGVNVIAADTDAEARRLFTSAQQSFTNMFRGARGKLPAPIDDIEDYWTPMEKMQAGGMLACSIVGGPATIRDGLERLIAETGADEFMVAGAIHDSEARLRSYTILGDVHASLAPRQQAHRQRAA
jgi:luciferase family oxidoreductase group 1